MGAVNSAEEESSEGACASSAAADRHEDAGPRTTRSHLVTLCRANNKFGLTLYHELAGDGKRAGDLLISPLTLGVGLGMIALGAEGRTRDEFLSAMFLHEVLPQQLPTAYAALHWDLIRSSAPHGCLLQPAVRVFAQTGQKMAALYEDIITGYEIARVRYYDFKTRPDQARKEINRWADDRTRGHIKDMLQVGSIDRESRLILVSAVYVKAQWKVPFDIRRTVRSQFHVKEKETCECEMMNVAHRFRVGYTHKLDAEVLELPLTDSHTKFYVVLPRKVEGVCKVESKLSRTLLDTLDMHISEANVDVYIPRFRYETMLQPVSELKQVGLKQVFLPGKANLENMDPDKQLFLSKVFHYVQLEIEESSLEMPSTSSASESSVLPAKPDIKIRKTFRANHPFFYYIRDDRTGSVVAMGRLVRPFVPSS